MSDDLKILPGQVTQLTNTDEGAMRKIRIKLSKTIRTEWVEKPPADGLWYAKRFKHSEPEIVRVVTDDEDTRYVVRMGDDCGYEVEYFARWWPVMIPSDPGA